MKKTYGLLILGSILEYYDYAIYIYFAKAIGNALIPINNNVSNLVATFSIFAISALIRPLGGMIFAHNGDRKGRKNSFTWTILLMAIPTFCIGLIPNQLTIGILATILLLFLRSVQGFAIGGEIPASMVFAYEISKTNKALNTNIVMAGTNIGLFLASVVCAFLLDHQLSFIASWRIAFFIGGVFGIISYFLRKKLSESPEFNKISTMIHHKRKMPFMELVHTHKIAMLQMTIFACYCASLISVFSIFMPNYLNQFQHIPLSQAMSLNSSSIIIFIISALIAGKFDYLFNKAFLIISAVLFNGAIYWTFNNISQLDFNTVKLIQLATLCYMGIICGRLPVIICNFFPTTVRYSGVALSYNISFGIVVGVSQLILTSLIVVTSNLQVPMYYIVMFSIPYLFFLLTVKADKLNIYQ